MVLMGTRRFTNDAARTCIGYGPMALEREYELLVLGADAKLRVRPAARLEPRDQLLARLDGRHVDLIAGHSALPAKGRRTYTAAARKSNWAA